MAKGTGRFNYMILRQDCCQVVFKPYDSPIQLVIAEDLTKDEASSLMDYLNNDIDETCNKPVKHGS